MSEPNASNPGPRVIPPGGSVENDRKLHERCPKWLLPFWRVEGVVLVILTLIMVASRILVPFFGFSLEALLIFCAGFSNLAAVSDISVNYFPKEDVTPSKKVRCWLGCQAGFLFLLLGVDTWRLFSDASHVLLWTPFILVVFVFTMLLSMAGNNSAKLKGWTVCVLGISLSCLFGYLLDLYFDHETISDYAFVLLHLVGIPAIYCFVDLVLQKDVDSSRKSLGIDIGVLVVGLACCLAGFAASHELEMMFCECNENVAKLEAELPHLKPELRSTLEDATSKSKSTMHDAAKSSLFEAGACAAVLLLGNFAYLIVVHKNRETEP